FRQLIVREPLQIEVELDTQRVGGREVACSMPVHVPVFFRPTQPSRGSPQRRTEMLIQRVEEGVSLQQGTPAGNEAAELPRAIGLRQQMPLAKMMEQQFENLELGIRHAAII